jgi:O-antigen biosynthesis protein
VFARHKLDFSCQGAKISVVMVAFNRFELTMQALASLRGNFAGGIGLILVDNGSTDATRRIEDYVRGANILHVEQNQGFFCAAPISLCRMFLPRRCSI